MFTVFTHILRDTDIPSHNRQTNIRCENSRCRSSNVYCIDSKPWLLPPLPDDVVLDMTQCGPPSAHSWYRGRSTFIQTNISLKNGQLVTAKSQNSVLLLGKPYFIIMNSNIGWQDVACFMQTEFLRSKLDFCYVKCHSDCGSSAQLRGQLKFSWYGLPPAFPWGAGCPNLNSARREVGTSTVLKEGVGRCLSSQVTHSYGTALKR